ncbi:hypothetical protein ABE021_03665 [Sporosarcina gallistercoris]|uniref:hypothetical protein n=1 Tax=Sporosarcina gallistercoris TaxID=2762245 RepID=UPI003D2C0D94
MALATKPDLLLLDEPLSALDEEIRLECQNELWKIPFIVVTDSRSEAEKVDDRVLHLK